MAMIANSFPQQTIASDSWKQPFCQIPVIYLSAEARRSSQGRVRSWRKQANLCPTFTSDLVLGCEWLHFGLQVLHSVTSLLSLVQSCGHLRATVCDVISTPGLR